jgi:hypothetical protein
MELGLRFSRGLQRANDLDCRRHRDNGKRFIVRADEKLTAFMELESAVRVSSIKVCLRFASALAGAATLELAQRETNFAVN